MKFFAMFGPRLEMPTGTDALRQSQDQLLGPREREVERREIEVQIHVMARAAQLDRTQAIQIAARARDDVADALDALADQREKELDMEQMLPKLSTKPYGSDWPDRRQAVLHRQRAKADRQSAREDLAAIIADLR